MEDHRRRRKQESKTWAHLHYPRISTKNPSCFILATWVPFFDDGNATPPLQTAAKTHLCISGRHHLPCAHLRLWSSPLRRSNDQSPRRFGPSLESCLLFQAPRQRRPHPLPKQMRHFGQEAQIWYTVRLSPYGFKKKNFWIPITRRALGLERSPMFPHVLASSQVPFGCNRVRLLSTFTNQTGFWLAIPAAVHSVMIHPSGSSRSCFFSAKSCHCISSSSCYARSFLITCIYPLFLSWFHWLFFFVSFIYRLSKYVRNYADRPNDLDNVSRCM